MAISTSYLEYDKTVHSVVLPFASSTAQRDWLLENIGPRASNDSKSLTHPLSAELPWTVKHRNMRKLVFMFYRQEDAMLFKLRWL